MPVNYPRIIDGDGHVMEDFQAILDMMPAAYQKKHELLPLFPPLDHLHSADLIEFPPHAFEPVGREGWLEFLEDVGIESTVLYPTHGLSYGKVVSRYWAIDLARGYNDWLYENYCKQSPRFKGMALIPLQDPEAAVLELRRAVEELGMCGAMLAANGINMHLGHKFYFPIYAEAERLGCCLGVHGGSHDNFGMDDLNPYAPVHALGHSFGQMVCFGAIIFNGICDKFPNVRFGFLEGGVAWLLVCLERFDRSYETHIEYDPRGEFLQLKKGERVSDYVTRHMREGRLYIGCEGGEPDLAHAISRVGNEPFVFSSDFPHEVNNDICKEEIGEVIESNELTEDDKAAVLYRNAERFYRLAES